MSQTYKVLIVAEMKNIDEEGKKEIHTRLEDQGFEQIPTVTNAWEFACEANDETDAKDKALDLFANMSRTIPHEVGLVVQSGTSQILRRRKKFEP